MKNLLLLHGALGAASQFSALGNVLADSYAVHAFNFSGHGGQPFAECFGIETFAKEALRFLDENNIEKTDIFGYSMGGYVALQLARTAPERVGKIITLATKFDWTPETAGRETKLLDPEKIVAKVPAFAQQLAGIHAPNDWRELLRMTVAMMLELGNNKLLDEITLGEIHHPVLVCRGDQDQMVSQAESEWAVSALPHGKLRILEGTPHPFEKVATHKIVETISTFF